MTQPDWFIARNDKEYGPYTWAQLKEFASSGRLVPDDLVRTTAMKAPNKARNIKGLFPEATPVSTLHPVKPPVEQKKILGFSQKTVMIAAIVSGSFFFVCCGGCGIAGFIGALQENAARKQRMNTGQDGDKQEISNTNSKEYRDGYQEGLEFGRDWGQIAYGQGRLIKQEEIKNHIRSYGAVGITNTKDWEKGYEDGCRKGLGKNFSNDP